MRPLWEYVHYLCLRCGVSPEEANDCVSEVMLRYNKRTGAFPCQQPAPDLPLLRQLARDVACEHIRARLRRQRLEQEYLAQMRCERAVAPSPMALAIAHLDGEQFHTSLPDYLRQTLRLMEQGYSAKEIAEQLGVAVGTVYAYQNELRRKFVDFFGYDPRKSGVRVGNYSGYSARGDRDDTQEVDDAASSEGTWGSCVVVGSSEPDSVARHPCRHQRVARGGGA